MIAGLLVMYLTKSWEGEHGVEILTRQLRAKAQFEGGSLREGTQTLKGILELIGSRRLKDPELQEAFEFASRHPFFSKLDTLVSEGDSLLKSEDYEQAQERYSRVLKLIDPGEPLLAGIRLEVEGKLKSEEIAKGAQGLRRVGDQWLNDAQTKAWKEVEALAKDARKKIDLEYYSSAKTSLNAAIDLINGLPDKSHPEKSRIEELLNSNDVQKGSSGFKKFEGEWISPARFLEVMKARGLVEYKGKWVTPVEKETEIMTARGMVIFRDKWVTPDEKFALEQKEKGLVLWKGKWISEEEYRKVATGEVKGRVGIQLGSGRVVYMATDKIYLMKNRLRWAAGKSGFASLRKIESFGNAQSAFRSALNAGNVLYNIKTDFEGQYWGTGIPEGTYYYYCLWTQNVNNCIWTGQVSVKAGHVTTLDLTGQNLAEYYSSSR
jgi:tetratricopeptide (TPR) repeat protein